jgi:hypothetical protein
MSATPALSKRWTPPHLAGFLAQFDCFTNYLTCMMWNGFSRQTLTGFLAGCIFELIVSNYHISNFKYHMRKTSICAARPAPTTRTGSPAAAVLVAFALPSLHQL